MTSTKRTFRKLLDGSAGGEVLIPIIQTYLYDPKFPSFTIDVEGWKPKPPDGYFHPSTHPMADERLLYHYLVDPHLLVHEVFDPTSTMTVTQGHFWHDFIQMVGLDSGFLLPSPNPTPGRNKAEWYWLHEPTKSRGWSDGVTSPLICLEQEIFEFKTMRGAKASKIAKGRPESPEVQESFRLLVPDYYAQAQEYLRLSGLRRWRGIILSLEWPFPMREIVLDADRVYQHSIAAKYERVLQAAADQRPPTSCCGPLMDCPARQVCTLGMR